MLSDHLIFCHPLLLLPSVFPRFPHWAPLVHPCQHTSYPQAGRQLLPCPLHTPREGLALAPRGPCPSLWPHLAVPAVWALCPLAFFHLICSSPSCLRSRSPLILENVPCFSTPCPQPPFAPCLSTDFSSGVCFSETTSLTLCMNWPLSDSPSLSLGLILGEVSLLFNTQRCVFSICCCAPLSPQEHKLHASREGPCLSGPPFPDGQSSAESEGER